MEEKSPPKIFIDTISATSTPPYKMMSWIMSLYTSAIIPPIVVYAMETIAIIIIVVKIGRFSTTERTSADVYRITLVESPRENIKRADKIYRVPSPNRRSAYSYIEAPESCRKTGTSKNIMAIMETGRANSNCNHLIPPPALSATNAGALIKLIALTWFAARDTAITADPIFLPPRK
ncbi:MAG: hypothetical protein SCABRO_02544 [Candidatus Scalindua brodae]|uniref:Uncharacterized protein n=1 Tax=Candidatus Scalindua brodae TaxID=237368 RepID=A0A0B0EI60_9BACT|nr:MAG: hypothetical protein SCABRO_02544 [Candidatus Scalindua brodae]